MPYRLLARHSSQFFLLSFNGSNHLLTHQKIEPGAGSVVESVGQDFWYFLFTAALDILAGSYSPYGFDKRIARGSFSVAVLFCFRDWSRPID